MPIPLKEFQQRRQDLMNQMESNSIAILASANSILRNGDSEYRYRQNSDMYYLSGFAEAQSVLVLIPGREQGQCLLFCQEKDPLKELWNGKLLGPEAAIHELGMDDAFPITDIDDILPGLIEGRDRVYYAMGKDEQFDHRVMEWVKVIRKKVRSGAHSPGEFLVLDHLLHEMRLLKSRTEIEVMRESGQIAVRAHKRAMQLCRPGMFEYEVEAEFMHEFFRSGCRAPAYTSIVAGGDNACILHYTENSQQLCDGDLLLIDAGCEFDYYASDITCTFPVNGKFSPEQKAIYELVLKSQQAAIELVRPGNHWDDPHNATVRVLTEGLKELGLLQGDVDALIESGGYRDFYMHRAGHWLGMDVHDVGDYKIEGKWRQLEPGMVMTVEPGLYISPDNTNVEARWRGIGVRIEDDVAVTRTGHEVLTSGLPRTVQEIEDFMAAVLSQVHAVVPTQRVVTRFGLILTMTFTNATHYDVVIVGAGMVGASLALALQLERHRAPRILLVEASHIHRDAVAEQPGFDARSTVLSEGTARYFAQLGLWQSIAPLAQPIRHIHVSDQGHFGSVRMHSDDEGVDALGHVVENASLGQAFNAALIASDALEVCSPAIVTHLRPAETGMQLSLQSAGNTTDITASLVVLAEGGRSGLCAELGISHRNCSYEQSAVIANVALSQAHRQIAYERFTPKGPLALLPLDDSEGQHRAALIWTHPAEEAQHTMDLEDAEFVQRLQLEFGQRAGSFIRVGKRTQFPLSLQLADEQIRPGLVLLGNVAHSLHPVAGQGFNLALRDTMALARNIRESLRLGHSPGSFRRLQEYLDVVRQDQIVTITFSDYMTRLFSSNSRMLALVRQFGMASIDLLPPLKHQLSRHAMGLARPRISL